MAMAKEWSVRAETGGPSIKDKLSEYIDRVRKMYSETRFAVSMNGHDSSGIKSQLNFKKTRDKAQTATTPSKSKSQPPAKKQGLATQPANKTA